ncbi:uncharacterized protein LOC114723269, partial [Neltuma alba]|uniref:uncharacterized protein LOC114723269 n=1 Tax=Neltuma alba TaxID=207710 RepID=UPI0010A30FFB
WCVKSVKNGGLAEAVEGGGRSRRRELKKKWEEVGLVRRQAHEQVTTFTGSDIHIQGQEISETKDDSGGIEKKDTTSPSSDPIIPGDSTPPKNVTIQTEKRQEISETKDGSSFSDIEKKKT